MTRDEIEQRYRAYIADLNAGRLREALKFYGESVTYNDHSLTAEQFFEAGIAIAYEVAPDTQLVIDRLLIEGDVIAVRILRTGTAVREYMGIAPTGRTLTIAEHAFYRLERDRCVQVWSLVDLAAILADAA